MSDTNPVLKNNYLFSRAMFVPVDFVGNALNLKPSINFTKSNRKISINCLNLVPSHTSIHDINKKIEQKKNQAGKKLTYKGYAQAEYSQIRSVRTDNLHLEFIYSPAFDVSHYDLKLESKIRNVTEIEILDASDRLRDKFSGLIPYNTED